MSPNFYVNFLYFMCYSLLGWCSEVVFCSIPAKKFINRGFLNGPLCPIYGFGALIVVAFLDRFKFNVILVFIFGVLLTSTLEYITSYVMEKLFHSKWWDYSNNKFNINGRVCLLNSVLFGLLSVFVMFRLHPWVVELVGQLSYIWVQVASIVLIILVTIDSTVTVQTILSLNERMVKIRELSNEIKEKLDAKQFYVEKQISERVAMLKDYAMTSESGKDVLEFAEVVSKEFGKLTSTNKFLHRRLIHAFPEIKSNTFGEQLSIIKETMEKPKSKIKSKKKSK